MRSPGSMPPRERTPRTAAIGSGSGMAAAYAGDDERRDRGIRARDPGCAGRSSRIRRARAPGRRDANASRASQAAADRTLGDPQDARPPRRSRSRSRRGIDAATHAWARAVALRSEILRLLPYRGRGHRPCGRWLAEAARDHPGRAAARRSERTTSPSSGTFSWRWTRLPAAIRRGGPSTPPAVATWTAPRDLADEAVAAGAVRGSRLPGRRRRRRLRVRRRAEERGARARAACTGRADAEPEPEPLARREFVYREASLGPKPAAWSATRRSTSSVGRGR